MQSQRYIDYNARRRQDPVSCRLCRVKKLRCNRQEPCANCAARNVPCEREGQAPISTPKPEAVSNIQILDRLQRLEELLLKLDGTSQSTDNVKGQFQDVNPETSQNIGLSPSSRNQANALTHTEDAKWLQNVAYRDEFSVAGFSDEIFFVTGPVRQILGGGTGIQQTMALPTSIHSRSKLMCLPMKAEAILLFEMYSRAAEHLYRLIYLPHARKLLDEVYESIGKYPQKVSYGQVALLLSMFAVAAAFQTATDDVPNSPITSRDAQVAILAWGKSTFDILDLSRRVCSGSLEDIQAMLNIYFVVYNLEGFSLRARAGWNAALVLARELGLNRTDYHYDKVENITRRLTAETEIMRRVWWYLAATDWLVSISGGTSEGVYTVNPKHMAVNFPRNINDDALEHEASDFELPLSEPTNMSYTIWRTRLAEVCRSIVDAMPMSPSNPDQISYNEFISLDAKFEAYFNELPVFYRLDEESRLQSREIVRQHPYIPIQRCVLGLTSHTKRCRLHQPFLVRGSSGGLYAYSRDICLRSARIVFEVKKMLDEDGGIGASLVGFAGLAQHLFFATIALVMDLCFNKSEPQTPERALEVMEACKILENAKHKSPQASRFVDSLMNVLRKHQVRLIHPLSDEGVDLEVPGPEIDDFEFGMGEKAPNAQPFPTAEEPNPVPSQQSDFEEIWQNYIRYGPNFDGPDWDQLFTDLDAQL